MNAGPPALPRRWFPRVRLSRPSREEVAALVEAGSRETLSYADVGASAGQMPEGWFATDHRVVLGEGPEVWARAVAGLRAWAPFDLPWITLVAEAPPHTGQTVGFASRQLGVWGVHVVRIVDAWDEEEDGRRRFGFAWGTLSHHAVRGEERFSLRQDGPDGPVELGLRQFSQPSSALLAALSPVARSVQESFVREAMAAMVTWVQR